MLRISLVFFLFATGRAWAFPEMIRHGYASCVACHVSPTGGGILNSYGRELSREILSTWGKGRESDFAYGAVDLPDWLQMGGDARAMQVVVNNPDTERALFFNMQTDIEAAVTFGSVFAAATLGIDTSQGEDKGAVSRRHYVGVRFAENWTLRAGRFYPEHGLRIANHRRPTRFHFGFDQDQETYNAELSWADEKYQLFATAILGRPFEDDSAAQAVDQQGAAVSGHIFLWDRYRFGASVRSVSGDDKSLTTGSIFGIAGFRKDLFLMSEFVAGTSDQSEITTDSMGMFTRLNYEIHQGVHLYGLHEFYRADNSDPDTDTVGFGGGLQLFPRPHLELVGEYQLRRTPDTTSFTEHLYTLLFHFYL